VDENPLRLARADNRPNMTAANNHHRRPPAAKYKVNELLEHFSRHVTSWAGSSWAFALAVLVVILWGVTGPLFQFSDTWQLVINTGTTIVTFLMVFLIQRAQNKDALAIQLKLNELLASQQGASNRLINLEDWSEEEIIALHDRFAALSAHLEQVHDGDAAHSIGQAREVIEHVQRALHEARHSTDGKRRRAERNASDRLPKPSTADGGRAADTPTSR
jgi:low affinity Fe/Cu permease